MADIILPAPADDEEYIIRKKPLTELQILRNERDRLQLKLDSMTNPTNAELRTLGEVYHPYFITKRELDTVKHQINRITQ